MSLAEADKVVCTMEMEQNSMELEDRIADHLATNSSIVLKSQQRGEPDFTFLERQQISKELLLQNPAKFLYRFGSFLQTEHLQYFVRYDGDPEVDFYLQETMKKLNECTSRKILRNRRYNAMQKLCCNSDYFSEKEMQKRDPLSYNLLVAKHKTEEEREFQNQSSIDKADCRLTTILLEHIDSCATKDYQRQQEECEDDMLEEEDDSDEDHECTHEEELTDDGRKLLREEFCTSVYQDFLNGQDADFNYENVDRNEAYDPVDLLDRDEEERYFDEDDSSSQEEIISEIFAHEWEGNHLCKCQIKNDSVLGTSEPNLMHHMETC